MKLSFAATALAFTVAASQAQTLLTLPEDSPRATVSQRIGVTDITIVYHRPLVNGRKIWDGIVPYNSVWRAGANENTTIEFSTPVTVEGQSLAKGVYGLHMVPSANSWTIAFSKTSTDWGSFTYNKSEDALRVTVQPQPGEMHEALAYDFDAVKPGSVTAWLRWEKIAVPFHIAVDTPSLTIAGLRAELRSGKQYTWTGWDEAASYCLSQKTNLEEALQWADQSIKYEPRFENLVTKSRILTALHRDSDAAAAQAKAIEAATPDQLYTYARQLQIQEKKQAEAMEIFKTVVKRSPDSLRGHLAQARLASHDGNFPTALAQLHAAYDLPGNSQEIKMSLEPLLKRLEAKQDIN